MNNPKVFLAALLTICVLLGCLLLLLPSSNVATVEATVSSQTLTQSLDGHRRYLNVITQNEQDLLITSPAQIDCPKGSKVIIKIEETLFAREANYRFQACFPLQTSEQE